MMSNQVFSSTEELYDEASADEVLNSYHQESHMRYYENVVYVPHVFSPVMLVEYVPVFYNYLTYEPYLMDSFQVTYIPFIQVSYSYFVPYYYSYSPPEVFSSYTPEVLPQNEAETDSNSYPESSLGDESTFDDLSSSISHSDDETSVLSSSYSYISDEASEVISTQEPCGLLEGVVCNENDDSSDLNCVEENNIAREHTEGFVSVDIGIEANASNSSLLLLDDENSHAALDYLGNCLNQISFSEDHHVVSDVSSTSLLLLDEENSPADALDRSGNSLDRISLHEDLVVSDVSSTSLLVDVEKLEVLRSSDIDEKSSLIDIGKDEYERDFSPERCGNLVVFDDSIASNLPSDVPLHGYVKKSDDKNNLQERDLSPLKDIEKGEYECHFSTERCENHVVFGHSIALKSPVSDLPLHDYVKKSEGENNFQQSELSPLKDIEKEEYERCFSPERSDSCVVFDDDIALSSPVSDLALHDYVKKSEGENNFQQSELSPLKDIEKEEYERSFLPERCDSCLVFDDDIALKSPVSDLSLHDYLKKYECENKLQQNERTPLKNENVKRYDSHASPQMPDWSQGISLQDSLDETDVKVPDPFNYDNSEHESDSDGDPAITLQDILVSDKNWGVQRKEYLEKRRNTELYRSALEGDIRPTRSLPEVGTLATIFEDLPYPINDPYDDGVQQDQESVNEEYFELPPLGVERSKSSRTTLLPKKKRFRKTKKFFSGLFRCFRPPP